MTPEDTTVALPTPAVEPPPVAPDDERRPIYISWSALRSHEECRFQSAARSRGKKSPLTNIRSYFHGTFVDAVMEEWLSGEGGPEPGLMPGMCRDIMDRAELDALAKGDGVVKWKHKTDREDTIAWGQELVRRLEPILMRHVVPYPYMTHFRFKAPLTIPFLDGRPTTIYMVGEPDVFVDGHPDAPRVPPGFVVWDLKGTQDNSYWRKTVGQLTFYAMALSQLYGPVVKVGLIQPMCDQRVLEFIPTEAERDQMYARIMRMASDQWAHDDLPKEDSKGCSRCDVNHCCPKYQRVDVQGRMLLMGTSDPLAVEGSPGAAAVV
jgi:hypothetical protein